MRIWICNNCNAEVPEEKEPKICPICKQHTKGFEEAERKDPSDEDKKYSKLYDEAIETLEKYDKGCEPKELKFSCEG